MLDLILQTAAKTLGIGLGISAFVAIVAISGWLAELIWPAKPRKSLAERVGLGRRG